MQGLMRRLRTDQRGITTVVVAVCLVAFIGAAMLSLDAGNVWRTRRTIITGTDAAVLDAAQQFNTGALSPCPGTGGPAAANQHATDLLLQNHPGSIHDLSDPDQFEVTLLDPSKCNTGEYTPGKVRYDGRLTAQGFFSRFFGFDNTKPISSSIAAWGYITAIGDGLRPIPICDKDQNYQAYVAYWQALHDGDPGNDAAAQATYDGLWGTDQGVPGDGTTNTVDNPGRFPFRSDGFPSGEADGPADKVNPNLHQVYGNPALDPRFHTVHRIISPDPNSACGYANGNRGWVDLRGADINGSPGASNIEDWLLSGYNGEVSLTPHDCNTSNDSTYEDCGSQPGDQNKQMKALHTLTCPVATPAPSCDYIFPILVVSCVGHLEGEVCVHESGTGGENAQYVQVAFLFVVLRGFGKIDANTATLGFDMEFVDVQTTGDVSGTPPTNAQTYQTGTQLCGADRAENHCPF